MVYFKTISQMSGTMSVECFLKNYDFWKRCSSYFIDIYFSEFSAKPVLSKSRSFDSETNYHSIHFIHFNYSFSYINWAGTWKKNCESKWNSRNHVKLYIWGKMFCGTDFRACMFWFQRQYNNFNKGVIRKFIIYESNKRKIMVLVNCWM